MQYCTLGSLSSRAEETDIAGAIEAGRLPRPVVRRVAEYFAHLRGLDTEGFAKVRDAWIRTEHPSLVIFTGRREDEEPTTRGGRRVFAAIELDRRGRVGTLIKLGCDYLGAPDDWENNRADAVERFSRGTRV